MSSEILQQVTQSFFPVHSTDSFAGHEEIDSFRGSLVQPPSTEFGSWCSSSKVWASLRSAKLPDRQLSSLPESGQTKHVSRSRLKTWTYSLCSA